MSDTGFVLQVGYQHSYAVSAVLSLVLSSAENYAQTHQSQTCHLHSESTHCGMSFHYFKLLLSSMEDEWEVCYFIFPTSACMYTFILSVLPGNCLCDCSLGSPWISRDLSSSLLPFFVLYSLSSLPRNKAGYFLMRCLLPLFHRKNN